VVDRLMAPDMWTGWGIRTLSANHPAFNPYNYQTGSVWPHDNAVIAMGFKRYGFGAEAARVAHDVSVAASHFQLNQLPELYTASERDGASSGTPGRAASAWHQERNGPLDRRPRRRQDSRPFRMASS
jgi:glycogen debranching enzyme